MRRVAVCFAVTFTSIDAVVLSSMESISSCASCSCASSMAFASSFHR